MNHTDVVLFHLHPKTQRLSKNEWNFILKHVVFTLRYQNSVMLAKISAHFKLSLFLLALWLGLDKNNKIQQTRPAGTNSLVTRTTTVQSPSVFFCKTIPGYLLWYLFWAGIIAAIAAYILRLNRLDSNTIHCRHGL